MHIKLERLSREIALIGQDILDLMAVETADLKDRNIRLRTFVDRQAILITALLRLANEEEAPVKIPRDQCTL